MKQTENPKRNPVGQAAGKIHAVLCRLHEYVCRVFLIPVHLYRKYLSPLKGQGSCRFTPTCSAYCIEAVMEWGILIGLALTLWRVLRCNPFCSGGHDPVPKCPWRKDK